MFQKYIWPSKAQAVYIVSQINLLNFNFFGNNGEPLTFQTFNQSQWSVPWLYCAFWLVESSIENVVAKAWEFVFLSAMSLCRTSNDLNFLPSSFFIETKSWQKHQSLSDSNKLADINNMNKEFLPKNSS